MGWWHCHASLAHAGSGGSGQKWLEVQGHVLAHQCQDWPLPDSALVLKSTFPAFWSIGIVGLGLWVLSFRQEQQIQVATIFQVLAVARGGSQQGDPGDAGKPTVNIQEGFGY